MLFMILVYDPCGVRSLNMWSLSTAILLSNQNFTRCFQVPDPILSRTGKRYKYHSQTWFLTILPTKSVQILLNLHVRFSNLHSFRGGKPIVKLPSKRRTGEALVKTSTKKPPHGCHHRWFHPRCPSCRFHFPIHLYMYLYLYDPLFFSSVSE